MIKYGENMGKLILVENICCNMMLVAQNLVVRIL